MSWNTRFVSLKVCGIFHFDSVSFLFKFHFCWTKCIDSLTLKRHNTFQNYNNRKATHSFAPKQTAWWCFTLWNILISVIWMVRSILYLNSKQLHQKLYSESLYIVDITCHFLEIDQNFLFFPGILVLSWKVIGVIVMKFSINVPYM